MKITLCQYIDAVNIIMAYHKQVEEKWNIPKNKIIFLDDLDISIRLRNCLHYYFRTIDNPIGIHEVTTEDLLLIDMDKFAKIKNVGKRSFDQLQEIIIKIKINTL
jgi:hypothetical protein